MVADLEWRRNAACAGRDPELFFPLPQQQNMIKRAKNICARCPVRRQCLEFAIETRSDHGIFGATLPEERRTIRYFGSNPVDMYLGMRESCGSFAGYKQHERYSEPKCPSCVNAERVYRQGLRDRRRAAKASVSTQDNSDEPAQ